MTIRFMFAGHPIGPFNHSSSSATNNFIAMSPGGTKFATMIYTANNQNTMCRWTRNGPVESLGFPYDNPTSIRYSSNSGPTAITDTGDIYFSSVANSEYNGDSWVNRYSNGIWYAGQHLSEPGLSSSNYEITALAIFSSGRVLAGGNDDEWVSDNQGVSWTKISPLPGGTYMIDGQQFVYGDVSHSLEVNFNSSVYQRITAGLTASTYAFWPSGYATVICPLADGRLAAVGIVGGILNVWISTNLGGSWTWYIQNEAIPAPVSAMMGSSGGNWYDSYVTIGLDQKIHAMAIHNISPGYYKIHEYRRSLNLTPDWDTTRRTFGTFQGSQAEMIFVPKISMFNGIGSYFYLVLGGFNTYEISGDSIEDPDPNGYGPIMIGTSPTGSNLISYPFQDNTPARKTLFGGSEDTV